jgi:hypothetical protein
LKHYQISLLGSAVALCVSSVTQAQTPLPQLISSNLALGDPREAVLRFEACGTQVCARIVALGQAQEEPLPEIDRFNPNPSLRNRSVCGLQIIQGLTPDRTGWRGGTVYNPSDGKTFRISIQRARDGGFVLVVGGLPPLMNTLPLVTPARSPERACRS